MAKKQKNNFINKIKKLNLRDKRILIITIVSILSLLLLASTSFALFISRNSTEEKNLYQTGDLTVVFDDTTGNAINLNPAQPISDEAAKKLDPYTFTIENKGDYIVTYQIFINDVAGTTEEQSKKIPKNFLKYQLNNETISTLDTLNNNMLKEGVIYPGQKFTFDLRIWLDYNTTSSIEGYNYKGKISISGKAIQGDTSGANAPELTDNMIPVIYDDNSHRWVKADTTKEWYNYDQGMWANVAIIYKDRKCVEWDGITGDVNKDGDLSEEDGQIILNVHTGQDKPGDLTDGEWLIIADFNGDGQVNSNDAMAIWIYLSSNQRIFCSSDNQTQNMSLEEYQSADPGTPINLNDVEMLYVWIPRYKYRINNTGSTALPSMIDVEFESGVTSTGVSINTNGVAKTEYYTHPAFRDGSKVYKSTPYDQGGWDKELTGFWVEKYEGYSMNNVPNNTVNQSIVNNILIDQEWHLMKNTEWGAIAYLSQSKYGKMGNTNYTGANKEIYINNNSNLYVGRSSGNPNASANLSGGYTYNGLGCKITMCNQNRDLLKGTGASTTGTVYGIYDMSGNASEYVASNYNNSLASSGIEPEFFTTESNKKYYDSYTPDKTYILGDATEETKGWYNDSAVAMDIDNPFLTRGGDYNQQASAGIFNFENATGAGGSTITSRFIIIP